MTERPKVESIAPNDALKLPVANVPKHIAIVMDGNGRWAQSRGLPRSAGHVRGADTVRDIVEACAEWGVRRLTLYCFSNENWKRPQEELDALAALLKNYMIEQRPTLMKNNVRLRILGRRRPIADDVLAEMDKTVGITANNTGLTLALAINYGARQEIIDATRAIVDELLDPKKREATLRDRNVVSVEELIDERFFASKLYDPDAIDPDLFIRTGGEKRLSNYLLWQLSYAELWFTDVLWPDFTRNDLKEAIIWFQSRQRRFGDVVSR